MPVGHVQEIHIFEIKIKTYDVMTLRMCSLT